MLRHHDGDLDEYEGIVENDETDVQWTLSMMKILMKKMMKEMAHLVWVCDVEHVDGEVWHYGRS